MILTPPMKPLPRAIRTAFIFTAIAVLPMGFAQGQEKERRTPPSAEVGQQEPERSISVEDYKRAAARFEAGVKAGKISQEDADKRLIEMRKMIRTEKPKSEKEGISVEDYKRAAARFDAGVKAGKISREDADKRLIEMRKMIRKEEPRSKKRSMTVEEYKRAEVKIKAAVEAGRISPEDAEKRLIEMRKMIRKEG